MKVSLGMRLRDGPWGGGNLFGRAMVEEFLRQGIDIVHDLDHPDIDVIFLIDPRSRSQTGTFGDVAIARYLHFRNPRALIVHRINECDERKGTTGVNRRLIAANRLADHTVFIASWLRDLFVAHGMSCARASVILNGADRRVFHANGHRSWDGVGPLRLVTHHWGANWMKGFDVYEKIDKLLVSEAWRSRIAFTYVGNLPPGFRFSHASYRPPLAGETLARELRSHHVYITASRNEPAGMHHIEGAMCGLPLLYRDSGALPEYCAGFGIQFSGEDFELKLRDMIENYATLAARGHAYPHDSRKMTDGYTALVRDLVDRREEILGSRPPRRIARWLLGRVMHGS